MSYGMSLSALSRARSTRLRTIVALAVTAAALLALSIGASSASAAFTATGFTLGTSSTQAGAHPAITLSASADPVAGDANGDDLSTLQFDLPAGMLVNPQAVATPCPTATFDANAANCSATTQVGSISVTYRVAGRLYTSTGFVYSITPDSNSVINFGFVVNAGSGFQKFLFKSGKAVGLTTVRPDYGLSILVPNIPKTIKSTIGISTSMTIANVSITLNSRAGTATSAPFFTFAPTRCTPASSKVSFTSYAGVSASKTSSYTPTGCDQLKFDPSFSLVNSNTKAGQATGISATVTMPTADAPIQQSHVSDVKVVLNPGTTINLSTLNALALCSETQLAADACPAASRMGSANVNVPFLPAPMTGDIYLTSRDGVQFAYILRGARGVTATLRGSSQPGSNGLETTLQTLPQVPWTSATLNFTSLIINNPANSCPNATAWAYINGYSGGQMLYGTFYDQTGCPPDTTLTTTVSGTTRVRTPKFEFTSPTYGATFQCSVDTAAYAACATPFITPSLVDGAHTFSVRAVSGGLTDPTPATASFRVDATPPTITIASPASGATVTTSSVTLDFTTERGAGNYCLLDNGNYVLCTSPKVYTDVADGPHRFTVISIDPAGNAATLQRNFTVSVPKTPVVTLTAPVDGSTLPTNMLVPQFTATSPSGTAITSIQCTLYVVYYTDPVTGENSEYEDSTFPCKSGDQLRQSENDKLRLQVDVTDANGLSSSATATFTTGINPPYGFGVIEADAVSNLSISERTPTFRMEYTDTRWPNPQLDCALISAGATPVWNSCGTPGNIPPFKVTTPLANGSYSLLTRVRSGNITGDTASMDFRVGDWSSKYAATTTTQQAGAHPDLDVDITPTGAGQMRSVDMNLPKGLIGSLSSFPRCPDASVATAVCPLATKVGTVDVDFTVYGGLALKRTPGDVYFTGPQSPGDVAGLVIRVYGPIKPFADVIIPLRIQLTNNAQVMRVFSDSIPTDVGNINDPTVFIRYWLKDFKMHINGSAGSPFPLLTNPSSCTASQFSTTTGGLDGIKTAVQTIPYAATGCNTLPFNPTISQTFTSTTAGTLSGVNAEVNLPAGNSTFKTLKVNEPGAFGPNSPSFGLSADQCPATSAPTALSTFDATNCPASAKVGTMTIDSPLLTGPLNGTVYLINKSPLPWLGVKLDDVGIAVRLIGVTSLPQVDLACDPTTSDTGTCPTQIAISFGNIPDLAVTRIRMTVDGPNRAGTGGTQLSGQILAVTGAGDPSCLPTINANTLFTPSSGTPNVAAAQPINFSGCSAH